MTIGTVLNTFILGVVLVVFIYVEINYRKQIKVLGMIKRQLKTLQENLEARSSYNLPPGEFEQTPLEKFPYCICGGKLEYKQTALDGINNLWECPECREMYVKLDDRFVHVFGYPEDLNLEGGNHDLSDSDG